MGRKASNNDGKSGFRVLRVNTAEAYHEMVEHFGSPITIRIAARIAEVSRQRIHNLLDEGRFTRILIYEEPHISEWEFSQWLNGGRRNGKGNGSPHGK